MSFDSQPFLGMPSTPLPSTTGNSAKRFAFAVTALFVLVGQLRAREPGDSYVEKLPDFGATFEMVAIPGGDFTMRAMDVDPRPPNEIKRGDNEYLVSISPFWMGKTEMPWGVVKNWLLKVDHKKYQVSTLRAFEACPYSFELPELEDDEPAAHLSHFAAKRYCHWLSLITGRFYRLPTEAEWEYACRAGSTGVYSWGEESLTDDQIWEMSREFRCGQEQPNAWGLYDMEGNAQEWVCDGFHAGYSEFGDVKKLTDPVVWPVGALAEQNDPYRVPPDNSKLPLSEYQKSRWQPNSHGPNAERSRWVRQGLLDHKQMIALGSGVARGGCDYGLVCFSDEHFACAARYQPARNPQTRSDYQRVFDNSVYASEAECRYAVGFRVASPVKVPSREVQLWHWGIYEHHKFWSKYTIEPTE